MDGMLKCLENGADVDQTDVTELKVFEEEMYEGKMHIQRPRHFHMTCLHWASYHCHLNAMRILLQRGAGPNHRMETFEFG